MTQERDLPELVRDARLEAAIHEHVTSHGRRGTSGYEEWNRVKDLGQGGCGIVYLERKVKGSGAIELRAVKKINIGTGFDLTHSECKRYVRELEALAKFSQPRYAEFFVTLHGWYTDPECLYMPMEYCEHLDLGTYLRRHKSLPEDQVHDIGYQLLQGLSRMHDNGFAHRDLKPANVLIKRKPPEAWWVKLCDLGLSRRSSDASGSTTVRFTPDFMAPELIAYFHTGNSSSIDPFCADMWCLGETVARALTGYATFARNELLQYQQGKIPLPSGRLQVAGASEKAIDFVCSLMQVDPILRMTTTSAARHPWLRPVSMSFSDYGGTEERVLPTQNYDRQLGSVLPVEEATQASGHWTTTMSIRPQDTQSPSGSGQNPPHNRKNSDDLQQPTILQYDPGLTRVQNKNSYAEENAQSTVSEESMGEMSELPSLHGAARNKKLPDPGENTATILDEIHRMRSRLPSDAQTGRNSIVERFLADATSYAVTPSSEESDPSQKSAIAGPHPSPKADDYEARLKKFCESCDLLKAPVWNCRWCDMDFCDPCWYLQGPHKPGRTGPDGYPHEKADPIIVARFKSILTPTKDQTEQQGLCLEDDNALWFGVARDALNSTVFTGYERYSALMNECNTGEHVSRCPQLVSFIGQIGTGKSTLIKMLIDQQEMQYHPDKREFLSPVVVSSRDERSPTSSGVRLYSDPATCQGEFPRLYADCEGPEEGYHLPAIFHTGDIPMQTKETVNLTTEEQTRAETSKERQTRRRKFERAGLSEEKKRQYAVTELYPRILYAFSDVVVFVLRDSKTIEASALSLLIAYASSSLETSLNQPILPHAVIAVNAVEVNINQEDWDPLHTTKSFMSHTAAAMLLETPAYRRLAEAWRKRGRRIATIQDLLVLYYSSITVVKRLYGLLTTRLNHSLAVKRRSRMLANSEEFDLSIQSAFNHFSRDLHIPFNFLNSTYGVNTKSLNFGANILKLAVMMKSSTYTEPRSLFTELSFMVASCIVLDSIRQGFKGSFKWILGEAYLNHCDHALDQFCAAFWPCSFVNRRGRCVNMTERHNKGHQNARGEIIGVGQYQSDFTWDSFAEQWHDLLRKHTSRIVALVHAEMASSSTMTELAAVIAVHAININTFFGRIGGATKYVSHSACFCCLRGIAEHPLPCGHILCTACVKGFGKAHTRLPGSVTTTSCPLHSQGAVFGPLWEIHIKPALAGVRVLSLDGGGIRGIVVLEVLKSIEEELGGRIPVMNFFDLVVGTSIGGILALGLGVKEWSIQQSIELFPKLIDKIFTSKVLGGTRFGTSKYSTHHVEDALKECFKDDLIFGGFPEVPSAYTRKVAVTATTESGEHGVIITNYNRASDEQVPYQLIRSEHPADEFCLWEAARATSAAPIYFKPFAHTRTGKSFLDGGIYHNNPVRLANRESQTIWSDVGDHHPDLLLSLGTGRDDEDDPFSKNWPQHSQAHLKSVLDAEQTWRDFRMDVIGSSSFIHARRYVRINPKITIRRPKLDEKAKVFELQENIRAQMDRQLHRVKIGTVAHQLVASSFYFELFGLIRTYAEDPRTVITGTIACRFAAGSDDIRNLGRYVRKQHAQSFQQFFNIQELDCEKSKVIQIPLTADILSNMIDFGIFDMGMIEIPVTQATSVVSIDLFMSDDHWISQLRSGLPISGFPRSFLGAKESDRRGKMPGIKTGYMK